MRLLQAMYAVYRSRDSHRDSYPAYYSYGEEKSIDLSAFESGQLWSMLDEAESIGVRLVHGKKRLGPLDRHGCAQVCWSAPTTIVRCAGVSSAIMLLSGAARPNPVEPRIGPAAE